MTAAGTLNVIGSVPVTTTIDLSTAGGGWNLVAYPDGIKRPLPTALSDNGVDTDLSLVYAYHANHISDPWKLFGGRHQHGRTILSNCCPDGVIGSRSVRIKPGA